MNRTMNLVAAVAIVLAGMVTPTVVEQPTQEVTIQVSSDSPLLTAQTCRPRHPLTLRGTCTACPRCSWWNLWCRGWNRIQCAAPPASCPRVCS